MNLAIAATVDAHNKVKDGITLRPVTDPFISY